MIAAPTAIAIVMILFSLKRNQPTRSEISRKPSTANRRNGAQFSLGRYQWVRGVGAVTAKL